MSSAPQLWRKAVASTVLCSFVLSQTMQAAHAAATDISDVPMAIKNLVSPNIMFMLDNSGSMNNIVPEYTPGSGGTCGSPATVIAGGATAPAFPANTVSIDLHIVNGAQRINRVGSSGPSNLTSNSNVTWGTTAKTYCFNPAQRYNARLNANGSCGSDKCPDGYLDAVYTGDFLNWYFSNGGANFGTSATRKPNTKSRI